MLHLVQNIFFTRNSDNTENNFSTNQFALNSTQVLFPQLCLRVRFSCGGFLVKFITKRSITWDIFTYCMTFYGTFLIPSCAYIILLYISFLASVLFTYFLRVYVVLTLRLVVSRGSLCPCRHFLIKYFFDLWCNSLIKYRDKHIHIRLQNNIF